MEFKCRYCGVTIPAVTRGKQPTMCKSIECHKKARLEAVKRYNEKQKEIRKELEELKEQKMVRKM